MRKLTLVLALMMSFAISAIAQMTRVSGQVLSEEDGEPIVGATVRVEGTTLAVASDAEGKFTITGLNPADKRLEISYIGYEPKKVDIKPDLKIYLTIKTEMMDEVLVVAFGKQKRESFTGSASMVGAASIERQQVTNPIEALNGKVTGLQMIESNSFTTDPSITIRGLGSINASNEPLIVLDGLPYNGYWNDINPADIASMTVLKDAASNALYGARGANGVILITTKNAQRGNTKVNFSARWGANSDGRVKYDVINNPGEYYEAFYLAARNYYQNALNQPFAEAHANANKQLSAPSSLGGLSYMVYSIPENEYLIGTNGRLNPNAVLGNRVAHNGKFYTLYPDDWTDEGLRNGFRQEYNLNLSGGNDKYTFYGSLGYLDSEGIAYGNDIERYSARLKTEYQAFDFLRVGANAGYNHTVTNNNGAIYSALTDMAPIFPLYIRDGEGNIMTDSHGKMYDYGSGDNAGLYRPVCTNGNYVQDDLLDISRNSSNSFNIQGFADFDFLKHFRLTVNGSVYITENRINTGTNPYYGYSVETGGYVSVGHYRTTDTNFQQLLNYNRVFGLNTVDVLLGHEYSRNSGTNLFADRNRVAMFNQNHELAGAIIDASMDSYITNYNVEGYFLRAQYDYDNRYFASASFRRDGSSRFHPKHRWGNFWSLGAAWIMSKEEWFPKNWWLNMIKVKASYGEQGNDGIVNYLYTDTYTIKNSDGAVAYVFRNKGNENITWETVGSFNAGLEFELFNTQLRGGAEFYVRNTRDMLMWFSTPMSIGYSGYYDNIGDMRNTGVEVELEGDIISSRNFTWTVGMNLTWERNRVTYLPDDKKLREVDGVKGYTSSYTFYGEGIPVYTWYLKKYAGVDENGKSLFYRTVDGKLTTTTAFDNADYYLCDSALPDVFGGFHTSISLYGFDLNAQFNYSIGGKKFDSVYEQMMTSPYNTIVGRPIHKDVFNCWMPDNPNSNIPTWQYDDMTAGNESDRWLTDASYLTFKNLTLGYTLPKSITRHAHMDKVRVYVGAENIFYWTKRKGFDPRMDMLYGNYNSYSYYSYPMRTISGGLTVQF